MSALSVRRQEQSSQAAWETTPRNRPITCGLRPHEKDKSIQSRQSMASSQACKICTRTESQISSASCFEVPSCVARLWNEPIGWMIEKRLATPSRVRLTNRLEWICDLNLPMLKLDRTRLNCRYDRSVRFDGQTNLDWHVLVGCRRPYPW